MIVNIILPLILAFIMFSLGLGLRKDDFTRVARFPKAFGTGLLNQLILLPLVAFGIATLLKVSPVLAVGIMILSFCPGGVTSNVLARMAGGNVPLSISLTAVTSLISILTVPFLVAFSVQHFMGDEGPQVNVAGLGIKMFLLTAIPVLLGMWLTAARPALVEKISGAVSKIALVLFVFIIVAAVVKNRVV
ncbi:MAG: bile acid:sodium symporter, partial [Verrucomicrobiota bacterium]